MSMAPRWRSLLVPLALAAVAPAARAQVATLPVQPPTPQVVTNATEEVEVTPDRANLTLAVETRGRTAAAAAAENARIQAAVLDTLRRLGIASAQLRTQGVSISPEYEYPREGGRPTVVGYQARNAVQVEIRRIAQVGTLIDAGLAKGATSVGGLRFFASNVSEARREAMQKAVARTRADADAIAAAAGGSIGGVLEIVASPMQDGPIAFDAAPMMMAKAEAGAVQTPVEAGVLKVIVSVSARFLFVAK